VSPDPPVTESNDGLVPPRFWKIAPVGRSTHDITLGVEPFAIADAGHLGHEVLVGGDTR
jgi:hypothetical protein